MAETVVVVGELALTLAEYHAAAARYRELGLGLGSAPNAAPAWAPVAEPLLDSRQLAELLGVGDTLLETMAADGRIPSFRIGRALRFKKSEVEAALRPRDSVSPARGQPHEFNEQIRRHNQKATHPIGV